MAAEGSKENGKDVPAEVNRTPDYRMIYAHGALGIFTEYDYRLRFYNEIFPTGDNKKIYEVPVTIVMSPIAAKDLRDLLDRHIKEYEEKVGEIKKHDISAIRDKK